MRSLIKQLLSYSLLITAALFTSTSFQNCSSYNSAGNGGGYEGLGTPTAGNPGGPSTPASSSQDSGIGDAPPQTTVNFVLLGACQTTSNGIVSEIQNDSRSGQYYLIRYNCQSLTTPQLLDSTAIQINSFDSSTIIFNGQQYTRE